VKQRIPDTTADERLNGLEAFLEFWLGPRRPEYGEPVETLETLHLPSVLRRFYAFAGRWPPAFPRYCSSRFGKQDRFLPLEPDSWGSVHRAGPYVVFAAENQGGWSVATLAEGEDPIVVVSEDCCDGTDSGQWRRLERPLSHFLVTFVLQETLFSSQWIACRENAWQVFEAAGCPIETVWLDGEYASPHARQSYCLVDGQVLLRRDTDDDAFQLYAVRDAQGSALVQRLNLPDPMSYAASTSSFN
jgi:hypothetical protein